MSAPNKTQGLLHLREVGLVNMAKLYPNQFLSNAQPLELIVHLSDPPPPEITQLSPTIHQKKILNQTVPEITLHIRHTTNLPLKVETLIKQYKLVTSGQHLKT